VADEQKLTVQQGRPSMLEARHGEQVRRVVAMYTLVVTLIIFALLTMHGLATDTYGTDCFLDCSPSIDAVVRPLSAPAVGSGIENQARAALMRFWIKYRGITALE